METASARQQEYLRVQNLQIHSLAPRPTVPDPPLALLSTNARIITRHLPRRHSSQAGNSLLARAIAKTDSPLSPMEQRDGVTEGATDAAIAAVGHQFAQRSYMTGGLQTPFSGPDASSSLHGNTITYSNKHHFVDAHDRAERPTAIPYAPRVFETHNVQNKMFSSDWPGNCTSKPDGRDPPYLYNGRSAHSGCIPNSATISGSEATNHLTDNGRLEITGGPEGVRQRNLQLYNDYNGATPERVSEITSPPFRMPPQIFYAGPSPTLTFGAHVYSFSEGRAVGTQEHLEDDNRLATPPYNAIHLSGLTAQQSVRFATRSSSIAIAPRADVPDLSQMVHTSNSTLSTITSDSLDSDSVCQSCGRLISTAKKPADRKSNLRRHQRVKHGDGTKLVCSESGCGKSYERSDALAKHRRQSHGQTLGA